MEAVVAVVVLMIACCYAQLSQNDINTLVTLHNNARSSANPVPLTPLSPLAWDPTIASDAQNWVNECTENYSDKFYATLYGENALVMNPGFDATQAFQNWMGQSSSFSFADGSCTAQTCMNFQQIVSSNSTSFGCGVATCDFGAFFVCDYKTYSQYPDRIPYTPAITPNPTTRPLPTVTPTTPPNPSSGSGSGGGSGSGAGSSSSGGSGSGTTTGSSTGSTTGGSGYETIDYRGTKAVLGVHDQQQCGSCWAFSSVAIIEGVLGMRGLSIPLLSDQDVLDCSNGGTCDGGWTPTGLSGMIKEGGIESQADYPYTEQQGTCQYNSAKTQGIITKTGQTKGDFASMYNALAEYGPVGIAVYALDSWYNYRSGVLSADNTDINHAVTVVGYNSTLDAWIVKNSWGPSWGMGGFFYLSAQHPAGANMNGAFWAQ